MYREKKNPGVCLHARPLNHRERWNQLGFRRRLSHNPGRLNHFTSQQMEVTFYDQVRASKWLPYASTCSLTLPTQRCLESGIPHGHGHRGSERVNRLSKGLCVQETRLLTHLSSSAVQKRECVRKLVCRYTIHIGGIAPLWKAAVSQILNVTWILLLRYYYNSQY